MQLEELGHRFKTNSDTEVIIHLYEEEGVKCLQKLRGMFRREDGHADGRARRVRPQRARRPVRPGLPAPAGERIGGTCHRLAE